MAWSLVWRWGPVALWFFLISSVSTDAFSAEETGALLLPLLRLLLPGMSEAGLEALHIALRKAGHVAEFGVLALLAYRALAWGRSGWQGRAAASAALLAVGLAMVDEGHQAAFTGSRMASIADVGWDALGALMGLGGVWFIFWCRGRIRRRGRVQGALSRTGVEATGHGPSRPRDGVGGRA